MLVLTSEAPECMIVPTSAIAMRITASPPTLSWKQHPWQNKGDR